MDKASLTEVETLELGLNEILVDTKYHSRATIDDQTVHRYATVYRNEMKEGISNSKMPHLEVAEINGVYVLFDGFHRIEAMKKCMIEKCYAQIHKGCTFAKLPYLASKNNLCHGLQLKTRDIRKRVFRSYVRSRSNMNGKDYKSYRMIAEDLNRTVTYNTIRNWMKEDFPRVFEAMGDDNLDAKIDFEPIDQDDELVAAVEEAMSYVKLRFEALRDKSRGLIMCGRLRTTLDEILDSFPNVRWVPADIYDFEDDEGYYRDDSLKDSDVNKDMNEDF